MKIVTFKLDSKHKSLISSIGLLLLILLWIYTGMSKLLEQDKFVFQMGLSPMKLVSKYNILLGYTIPITEIAIALLLCFAKSRKIGLYSTLILLTAFELYIFFMLVSAVDLPCACGGVIGYLSWRLHLLFNTFFIGLALLILQFEYPRVRKRE